MDNCSGRRRPEYIPNRISDPSYLRILDTTLRDGDQSPGTALTPNEKLEIARELAKLKVDVIEAGFPVASKTEFESVKRIAEEVGNTVDEDGYVPVIGAVGRCNEEDIRLAWDAVKYAKRPRICTFIATSEIHMQHKLRMNKEQVVEIAVATVKFARSLGCHDVQFSAEDSCRSDREFLYHIFGEVIKAGATTVSICDTVGIMFPSEIAKLVSDVKANTHGIQNSILSLHCHNDLGLATANALAVNSRLTKLLELARLVGEGVYGGARQVDVTINGIGERAGNSSLEEVVMAIKCRGNSILEGVYTGINSHNITKTSKMVEEYSGMHVQPHKAIVGANAFAHQSGIHQDAMLKNKSTYEIMCPKDIGLVRSNDTGMILGKLSGRHALKVRFRELGYELNDEQFGTIFSRFKMVAEQKKVITDVDLKALVSEVV